MIVKWKCANCAHIYTVRVHVPRHRHAGAEDVDVDMAQCPECLQDARREEIAEYAVDLMATQQQEE